MLGETAFVTESHGTHMADLSTVEIAFRLFVAGVAMVGPTLLFLGFWRFMMWLRDDRLIDTLIARGTLDERPAPSAADILATATASHPGARRCPFCEKRNLPGVRLCRECGERIR